MLEWGPLGLDGARFRWMVSVGGPLSSVCVGQPTVGLRASAPEPSLRGLNPDWALKAFYTMIAIPWHSPPEREHRKAIGKSPPS